MGKSTVSEFILAGYRKYLSCVTICLVLPIASPSYAAPNLQDVRKLPGMIVFGDHQRKDTFYYLRTVKRLAQKDNSPDFQYHLNRYLGHRQTGNKDEFWVRGVIKFGTTTDVEGVNYQETRDQLSIETKQQARLLAAPVIDSYNRLVYATIASDDGENGFSGEIEGGFVSESPGNLHSSSDASTLYGTLLQRYTIGLTALDAELFWENFQNDNLSLSLAYGWTVKGMILSSGDEWVASEYAINNTLPIVVSPTEHPQLFSRNELWQQLRFTHSNLVVMCYDFINAENTDLYYVLVEIRFPTLRGQKYHDSVKFTAESDEYESTLEFELANDIKEGYEYRVRRLSVDGEMTQTDWIANNSAMLDVSAPMTELTVFDKPMTKEEL